MKIRIIISFLLFIFIACENEEELSRIKIEKINKHTFCIDHLVDSSFVVNIGHENGMIADIEKILLSQDRIIIKERSFLSDKPIYSYDFSGKSFVCYGKVGKGPNEYLSSFDIALNYSQEELYLYDRNNKQILKYNLETGKFIETLPIHEYLLQFKFINNDEFIAYSDEENENEFIVYNIKEKQKSFGKYCYNEEYDIEIPKIFTQNKETFFIRPGSDTLCKVSHGTFLPVIKMDFGKYSVDSKFRKIAGYNSKMKYFKKNKKALPTEVFKSDNIWMFKYLKEDKIFTYISDNNNELIAHFEDILYKDIYIKTPITIWNDFLVFPLYSDEDDYSKIANVTNLSFIFIKLKQK